MVFAHQGGWDEALMVLAPIALLFFLLWIANRRAKRQLEAAEPSGPASPGSTTSPGRDETAHEDPRA